VQSCIAAKRPKGTRRPSAEARTASVRLSGGDLNIDDETAHIAMVTRRGRDRQKERLRPPLVEVIDLAHPLVRLDCADFQRGTAAGRCGWHSWQFFANRLRQL
jgi:hypothetical protein